MSMRRSDGFQSTEAPSDSETSRIGTSVRPSTIRGGLSDESGRPSKSMASFGSVAASAAEVPADKKTAETIRPDKKTATPRLMPHPCHRNMSCAI